MGNLDIVAVHPTTTEENNWKIDGWSAEVVTSTLDHGL